MRITEPYIIFPRTLPSGNIVYYYQYRDETGIRSNAKSTGCITASAAKRFCKRLYNDGTFQKDCSTLFRNFAAGFFDDDSDFCKWKKINNKELSKSTLFAYRSLLTF